MTWIHQHILSLIIFAPLLGAGLILIIPKKHTALVRVFALATSLITFVFSLHVAFYFQQTSGFQFLQQEMWIPSLRIQYALGIDGFSLWLLLLTTLLMPIAVLFSWGSIHNREKIFYFFLLVLETGMLGAFCALDGFLFYLFWEAMLIPMYFLIGIFGHGRKIYAALKFFLFTLLGSILMLLAMIYLYFQSGGSFLLEDWLHLSLPAATQCILFAAFALSFAIKVPLIPLHTWLPDAHTEAPTAGSVILAGVLLKMGTYGFVRFAIPLFPAGLEFFRPYLMDLAVAGILYGSLVAMAQKDMKRLVAYSSIAHLGFVMLGLLSLNPQAITGSVYQMLNHGVSSGALFLLVGMLYDRTHTRQIADYGGIAKILPLYTVVFFVVSFSSIALPGTNGFVGEFLILSGSFQRFPVLTLFATLGVILSAVYMLGLLERVFLGKLNPKWARHSEALSHSSPKGEGTGLKDMNLREMLCMLPLVILILWMGLKPNLFLKRIELATNELLQKIEIKGALVELSEPKNF